jgi:hypothetical protein
LWSAFLQSLFAKRRGIPLADAYDEKMLGVIQDMSILAFQKLVPAEATEANMKSPADH